MFLSPVGPNLSFLLQERFHPINSFLPPGGKFLEIGAGGDYSARYLSQAQITRTDVEFSSGAHALCSGEALPFADASFDAAACFMCLHHMDKPVLAIRECLRVLVPGGRLYIIEPHVSRLFKLAFTIRIPEHIDFDVNIWEGRNARTRGSGPWSGNNAVGDLLFSNRKRFIEEFHDIEWISHRYCEFFLFLNSGGVNYRTLYIPLPHLVLRWLKSIDGWLCSRAPSWFAFSQEVILEKKKMSSCSTSR